MGGFKLEKKAIFTVFAVSCVVGAGAFFNTQKDPPPLPHQSSYQSTYHKNVMGLSQSWPIEMNYEDTKTNELLGEELLRRVYARIAFSDNIIRAEVDTLFENLKELIDKKLKRCERRSRRAGAGLPNLRTFNLDQYDPYQVNVSLAQQYAPKKTRY